MARTSFTTLVVAATALAGFAGPPAKAGGGGSASAQDKAKGAEADAFEQARAQLDRGELDEAERIIEKLLARADISDDDRARAIELRARVWVAHSVAPGTPDAKRKQLFEDAREDVRKLLESAASPAEAFDARASLYELSLERARRAWDPAAFKDAVDYFEAELAERRAVRAKLEIELAAKATGGSEDESSVRAAREAIADQAIMIAATCRARSLLGLAQASPRDETKKGFARAVDAFYEASAECGRSLLGAEAALDLAEALEWTGGDSALVRSLALEMADGRDKGALAPAAVDVFARATLAVARARGGSALLMIDRLLKEQKALADRPLGKALLIERACAKAREAKELAESKPKVAEAKKAEAVKELEALIEQDQSGPVAAAARARLAALDGSESDVASIAKSIPGTEGLLGGRPRPKGATLGDRVGLPAFLANRAARRFWAARGGGSIASESAVDAGLAWLARHQNADGRWGASSFVDKTGCDGKCNLGADRGYDELDTGVTGLALLAFLGAGQTPGASKPYGENVAKGIRWLLDHQDKEGLIGLPSSKLMYNHAISTMVLCEAYGLTANLVYAIPAQRAVNYLHTAQNYQLGWRYTPKCGQSDTSCTGWCVLALRTAQNVGLETASTSYEGALAWIQRVTDSNGQTGYDRLGSGEIFTPGRNEQWQHHPAMTGIGLVVRTLHAKRADPMCAKAAKILTDDLPKWDPKSARPANDEYYWFWATTSLFLFDGPNGPSWKKWSKPIADALCQNQRIKKDGCLDGSWDAGGVDRWGWAAGRVFTTAMGVLILETYYRYAPTTASEKRGS